jgi:hypothetical protein
MLRNGYFVPIVIWGVLSQGYARAVIHNKLFGPGFVPIGHGHNLGNAITRAAVQGVLGSCIPTAW